MTDKFKGWYPDYIENEKEREPILKLAKMMTGRAKKKLGLEKMTKYDPEYWGLALRTCVQRKGIRRVRTYAAKRPYSPLWGVMSASYWG